jgi:replicative DNA helicase Mcm
MSKDKELFKKLTLSIAPSIYGHKEIKASLLLQLFGGSRKVMKDNIVRRGDIHILLVGDPGAGKSQLLQFIAKSAPKARFISGKGASGAGLTAAVVKDEFLKGWSLEAGAMVLANKGICCIDELDKMTPEDRSALHEALEQQTITISKANIQATLRAETTVLAAANPKLSRFDPYTPIASQIDLPSTLINRFDLIFPIRDLPNVETDDRIAGHVLKLYQDRDALVTPIDPVLMRKYIAYAKRTIMPILTDDAAKEIKDFYVTLRNSVQSDSEVKPIPISARQLEAIIRLSEASARLRLSNKVTRDDAKLAISITKYCLTQIGMDKETGQFDMDRFATGMATSERSKIITVKEIINRLESERGSKSIQIDDISMEALHKNISEDQVFEIIEKLKKSGDIFEPKRGYVQKI